MAVRLCHSNTAWSITLGRSTVRLRVCRPPFTSCVTVGPANSSRREFLSRRCASRWGAGTCKAHSCTQKSTKPPSNRICWSISGEREETHECNGGFRLLGGRGGPPAVFYPDLG